MTGISTRVGLNRSLFIGPAVWAPPVVGAIVYPLLVHGFVLSVQAYQATSLGASKVMMAICALVLMSAELAVPVVAVRALIAIRSCSEPNTPLVRRVLHLVVATPPLQTVQVHHDVMTFLRGWYRSVWAQPIILVLFGTMIVTGTRNTLVEFECAFVPIELLPLRFEPRLIAGDCIVG